MAGEYISVGKEGVAEEMMDNWQLEVVLREGSTCGRYDGVVSEMVSHCVGKNGGSDVGEIEKSIRSAEILSPE